MKKIISILLTMVMLSLVISSVYAIKPVDGDIVDMWAQMDTDLGDSLVETADGIKITYGRPMWAFRVTTLDAYKLDGLTISFKGVSIADKNAMALGFGNTEGGWVDTKGMFFIQFTTTTSEAIGAAPNGYIMAKQGNDLSDVQPRIINDTLLTKKPAGDFKVSFTKIADGSWIYEFNGQKFPIAKAVVDANIKDQNKVYISFGNWGLAKGVITYTVADISSGASAQPTATKAATSSSVATSSKPASTSVSGSTGSSVVESSAATSSETTSSVAVTSSVESKNSTASETSSKIDDNTNNTGTIVVITIIVLALAGAGTAAFLLLKKKNAQ